MRESLEARVRSMIVERVMSKVRPDQIGIDDDLMKVWAIDSIKLVEIAVGLEEVFAIQVGDDDFNVKKFRTVRAIAAVVREKNPDA